MTPEHRETFCANSVCNFARARTAHFVDAQDLDAAHVAVLVTALEFATPGWSRESRARLFMECEE